MRQQAAVGVITHPKSRAMFGSSEGNIMLKDKRPPICSHSEESLQLCAYNKAQPAVCRPDWVGVK